MHAYTIKETLAIASTTKILGIISLWPSVHGFLSQACIYYVHALTWQSKKPTEGQINALACL